MKRLLLSLVIPWTAYAGDILYFTDLEGNRARLEAFYRASGGFEVGADGLHHLKKDVTLIYGGDVPDRYPGSLWIIDELLRLHGEGRFYLIAGNRDVNRMRFTNELSKAAVAMPPAYRAYTPPEIFAEESALPPDRARRMKYMLKNNMGAAAAFELLREEMRTREKREITDDDVVDEYLRILAPGGPFARLLGVMQLGARFGNTIFVHGGLTPENIGFVPGEAPVEQPVDAWLKRINGWYQGEFARWQNGYLRWSGEGPRAGEALIHYPMPAPNGRSQPFSLVTGRHADAENNPLLPDARVIEYLRKNGIQREVIGHTPIGDMAIVTRDEAHTFQSIFADNSYSARPDNATWIRLVGPDYQTAIVQGQVRLDDGDWRDVRAEVRLGEVTPVGRLTKDGARILGLDARGDFISSRMLKFKILNRVVDCQAELN